MNPALHGPKAFIEAALNLVVTGLIQPWLPQGSFDINLETPICYCASAIDVDLSTER